MVSPRFSSSKNVFLLCHKFNMVGAINWGVDLCPNEFNVIFKTIAEVT